MSLETVTPTHFSIILKRRLYELDISQRELCELIGLPQSGQAQLSRWINGTHRPRSRVLQKISEILSAPELLRADAFDPVHPDVPPQHPPNADKSDFTTIALLEAKIKSLEAKIDDHTNLARIFILNGWPIRTPYLLTSKDAMEMMANPISMFDNV